MGARMTMRADGARIQELAAQKCMTNSELSKRAQISPGGLNNAMKGRRILQKTAYSIARALSVTPSEIAKL